MEDVVPRTDFARYYNATDIGPRSLPTVIILPLLEIRMLRFLVIYIRQTILNTQLPCISQKGQIANLIDEGLSRVLQTISEVCERGLANAYGSDIVTRAKWENVAKMCRVSCLLLSSHIIHKRLPVGYV
jgi:hypothetical protein